MPGRRAGDGSREPTDDGSSVDAEGLSPLLPPSREPLGVSRFINQPKLSASLQNACVYQFIQTPSTLIYYR